MPTTDRPAAAPLRRRRLSRDGVVSEALFSPCGQYRYRLSRIWDPCKPRLLWVLLNPSTATELAEDATATRCAARARAMGFGGMVICNLFAFRTTRPAELIRAADPVGPANDRILRASLWAPGVGMILCGWGVHAARIDRGAQTARVAAMLRRAGPPLCHLGLTAAGAPRHPLYLPAGLQPVAWGTCPPARGRRQSAQVAPAAPSE
jgi:hypothetical protein